MIPVSCARGGLVRDFGESVKRENESANFLVDKGAGDCVG